MLTRVWCLLEMCYSPRISIILSGREVLSFQQRLRKDLSSISKDLSSISKILCKIDVENATSFIQEDRVRIFDVIRSMSGGADGLNNKVMSLIREWIAGSLNQLTATISDNDFDKDRVSKFSFVSENHYG